MAEAEDDNRDEKYDAVDEVTSNNNGVEKITLWND